MNHYCQSVKINGKLLFKISAVFETDELKLGIFKNEEAWTVDVSKEELASQSTKHNTDFKEYYANLRKYIELCPKDVDFDFKAGEFSVTLLLKNKMKILYFHTSLNKVNFSDSLFSLVDALYNKKVEYFSELNNAKGQLALVKNGACRKKSAKCFLSVRSKALYDVVSNKQINYEILEKKMDEFLGRRKADEENLYNNFIGILNEKKRQIQHLNDLLIAFRQGRPTVNPPVQVKRKNKEVLLKHVKKDVKATPVASSESDKDSDDDDDYDTDDVDSSNHKSLCTVSNKSSREGNNLSPSLPSTSKIKDEYPSDSPNQACIFPKRIRTETNLNMHSILPKKPSVDQENQEITEDFLNTTNHRLATIVNFDTQELLDNL